MRSRRGQLKFEVVADELRRQVLGGAFPGMRLPRKAELVEHFAVSQKTIESALRTLQQEGLLRGVRGTGVFITSPEERAAVNLTHRLALVLMPLSGHFYGELYEALREEFLESSLYLVSYNLAQGKPGASLFRLASVNTILHAPIKGVLVHGVSYWRHPFLERWRNVKSVFLDTFDAPGEPPGGAALIDYEAGGFLLAAEYLRRGHRRLAYVAPRLRSDVPDTPAFRRNHPVYNMLRGIERAVSGVSGATVTFCPVTPDRARESGELAVVARGGYDGIMCHSDYLAYCLGEAAREAGLLHPRDFALSGCLNTPWSQSAQVPFTSLDARVREISRTAVRLLNTGSSEIVKIAPAVIWR